MKKRIIAITAATAAVLALAIGYQALGASGSEEQKDPTPATSTESPDSTTPPDGSTEGPSGETTKEDDGEREGFTEDNTGKPGENK